MGEDRYRIQFDIIVVSFNSGDRLKSTLESVYAQDYRDYNIIIEDAGSTDGCLTNLKEQGFFTGEHRSSRTSVYTEPDDGIYDGMNKALARLPLSSCDEGCEYILFLNCGDVLHDRQVLGRMADAIEAGMRDREATAEETGQKRPRIYYGDQYNLALKSRVSSTRRLSEFGLFRNVPCHQVCFYDRRLFDERGYNTEYRVRADYEHFLYCVYERRAVTVYTDMTVSDYEGGGYSESDENRSLSAVEHRRITDIYMGRRASGYRLVMKLTLSGLRTRMANSPVTSGIYNRIKTCIYKGR